MKESSWKDCLDSRNSLKITPDKEKVKSLIETADERIKCSLKKINSQNANFVFEDYYSSIIELIHSLAILHGYKINNHLCLGFYIKEVLEKENLFFIFDDLRFKRNSLTYYGRKMEFEVAKTAIEKSKRLICELKIILRNKFEV